MNQFGVLSVAAAFLAGLTFSAQANLLIDFSPDTTGASVKFSTLTDSIGQSQVIGDQFTISTGVTLSGGSIFGNSTIGSVGTPVQFMIFSNPASAPIISISASIDTIDSVSTTTQSVLSRKHATITPTFLPAGTYWFALPSSDNSNWVAASGIYADNSMRQGTASALPTAASGLGDAFFQLESVPEPSTISLLGLASLALFRRNRRPTERR